MLYSSLCLLRQLWGTNFCLHQSSGRLLSVANLNHEVRSSGSLIGKHCVPFRYTWLQDRHWLPPSETWRGVVWYRPLRCSINVQFACLLGLLQLLFIPPYTQYRKYRPYALCETQIAVFRMAAVFVTVDLQTTLRSPPSCHVQLQLSVS